MTEIETGETSLTVRRTFDASRERVWEALTEPEQLDQWWGPDGFTTSTDEVDVQPGGEWRFMMTGPDGEAYPNLVVYDDVGEVVGILLKVTLRREAVEEGAEELRAHPV